jgi:hypothetical protein
MQAASDAMRHARRRIGVGRRRAAECGERASAARGASA